MASEVGCIPLGFDAPRLVVFLAFAWCHEASIGSNYRNCLVIGCVPGGSVELALMVFDAAGVFALLSFKGRRTSPVQGWMHLTLFGVFTLLLFQP